MGYDSIVAVKIIKEEKGSCLFLLSLTVRGDTKVKEDIQSAKVSLWTKEFLLICLTNFLLFSGFFVLLPTLPLYVESLGGGSVAVGMVGAVFAISSVMIRPIAGRLLDQGNRKRIFMLGIIISMVAIFSHQWAGLLVTLLLLRLIHGVGFGIATTSGGTIATDLIPPKRLGEGMGFFGLTNAAATAVAPAIGLLVLFNTSFNTLFLMAFALTALSLFASYHIKTPDFEKANETKEYKYFEPAAFLPSLVLVFVIMPFGAVVSFITLYSIERGIENIGFFFTIYALTLLFSRPVSGILADRYGYHKVLVPGILGMAVGMYIISIATSPFLFVIAAVVFGLGIGFVMPSLQSLAVKNVLPNRRGAANSTFFSSFDIGVGLGSLVWGIIAHYFGYSLMYLMTIIPAIIGLAIFLKYYKNHD